MSATLDQTTQRATRPDQMTGPRHVGEAVNAVVGQLNSKQHPNVVKMHDAIDGWIAKANELGGEAGIAYLQRQATCIERNRQNLADWCVDKSELWSFLEGVTNWDLGAADLRVMKAIQKLEGEGV